MKKILLTTAAVAALSTSAFAEMMDNQFYLRGDVSLSKFNNVSIDSAKHKSKWNAGLDVGAGYYMMDNVRAELVYNHVFSPKFNWSTSANNATISSKASATADAILARAFVDFADLGVAKLYAGVGAGWSKVTAKTTVAATGLPNIAIKAKSKNNFAYSVHPGSGFDVAEGVKLDVAYSWRDYGKSKNFVNAANVSLGKATLRSHNLSAGVRFDI